MKNNVNVFEFVETRKQKIWTYVEVGFVIVFMLAFLTAIIAVGVGKYFLGFSFAVLAISCIIDAAYFEILCKESYQYLKYIKKKFK